MYEYPHHVEVTYNRYEDVSRDYTKTIKVMALSREHATKKIMDYLTRGMLHQIEDDYIENTLLITQ